MLTDLGASLIVLKTLTRRPKGRTGWLNSKSQHHHIEANRVFKIRQQQISHSSPSHGWKFLRGSLLGFGSVFLGKKALGIDLFLYIYQKIFEFSSRISYLLFAGRRVIIMSLVLLTAQYMLCLLLFVVFVSSSRSSSGVGVPVLQMRN